MVISNKLDADANPPLYIQGSQIEEVASHKYLGVLLSSNLRWKDHIDYIATKARKKLNLMLPLKMKVDRRSLEIMYRSFVLSSIEYANVVWGGSPDSDLSKLKRIHLDAMRIITGATSRCNSDNLLSEYGGKNVSDYIRQSSLKMIFNIMNENAPQYLIDIHNHIQGERLYDYELRNAKDLRMPFCRLSLLKNSFFPRSILLWNELSDEERSATSLAVFKTFLRQNDNEMKVLYYYGDRWPSIHHARMRIGCSKLQKDLFFNLHVSNNPHCSCGAPTEDAKHFFLHCPNYLDIREQLKQSMQGLMPVTVRNLLFGNSSFSLKINEQVFDAVHKFIIASKRFD